MLKNITIAALAAALALEETPCFRGCSLQAQAAVFAGISIPLLFFCLFCENCAEKWRVYRRQVKGIEDILRRLRGSNYDTGENGRNHKEAGREPGHALHVPE